MCFCSTKLLFTGIFHYFFNRLLIKEMLPENSIDDQWGTPGPASGPAHAGRWVHRLRQTGGALAPTSRSAGIEV